MEIFIKNMVCDRCILAVKSQLKALGMDVQSIELGKAVVYGKEIDKRKISEALVKVGFELLEDKNAKLVNKIKSFIIDYVHNRKEGQRKLKLSALIEKEAGMDYNYVSGIFSSIENSTIEKYFILQKIEKVKELLTYGELTLNEIALQLDYSSTAHLSKQFKDVTGFSPSEFRKLKTHLRKPLDEV